MSELKQNVMKKVYTLYIVRRVMYSTLPKFIILLASIYFFSREVFVSAVVQNAPSFSEIGNATMFFVRAFANTHLAVQTTIVLAVVAGAYFLADLVKSIKTFGVASFR